LISPSDARDAAVAAAYYDGRESTRHEVTVRIEAGEVVLSGRDVSRRAPLAAIEISQPLGTAPRVIRFGDGAFCAVEDTAALAALLAAHGMDPARVTQWEGSLRWVWAAVVVFVLMLVLSYRYGVPAVAAVVASQVPAPIIDVLSRETLDALDGSVLLPSTLPVSRQKTLADRFQRLRAPDGAPPAQYSVLFRRSSLLGANAFALPSGTMVVTDDLVALAARDDDIMAVLAHEAGHVELRHGLRLLFQNSIVALAVTWFVGDVSMLVAAAPTALLQAKYSRDLEREADRHAVAVLAANAIPRERFTSMLERIDAAARGKGEEGGVLSAYLSSHPVTRERLDAIRAR
jgi:Zn-dependent protease with chaperone function